MPEPVGDNPCVATAVQSNSRALGSKGVGPAPCAGARSKTYPLLEGDAGTEQTIALCACGCGEQFEPKRSWQNYLDSSHRLQAKRARAATIALRVTREEKRYLDLRRNRATMRCTPAFLRSPELTRASGISRRAAIHHAALWLRNRLAEKQEK